MEEEVDDEEEVIQVPTNMNYSDLFQFMHNMGGLYVHPVESQEYEDNEVNIVNDDDEDEDDEEEIDNDNNNNNNDDDDNDEEEYIDTNNETE